MEHFIQTTENALSPDTCNSLIQKFKESSNRSEGVTGGGLDRTKKLSQDLSISKNKEFTQELKSIVATTSSHIINYFDKYFFAFIGPLGVKIQNQSTGQLTNITSENYSSLARPILPKLIQQFFRLGEINMQHYEAGKGGYPYWHSESYPDPPDNEALHRILLFMYYLNEVKEGGETDFYYQQQRIKPGKGKMVIAPAYFTHTHRGNIPISSDKYIITSWVLFQRGDALYRQQ